jgi:hypothetical protein
MRNGLGTASALAALVLAAGTSAVDAEEFRREVRDLLGGSVNLPGIQNTLEVTWVRKLSQSTNPLVKDAHLAFGVNHVLTPSHTRLGGFVQYAPLSVIEVRAGFEPVFYFGAVGSLLSFEGYDADYSKELRDRDEVKARAESAFGRRFYVAPALQARFGRVAARVLGEFDWWTADADGPFFYEPLRDVVIDADGDSLMVVTSLLLYEWPRANGRKLSAGAYHRLVDVYDSPGSRSQRLGGIAAYDLGPRRFGVKNPSAFLIVYDYVQDPFKEGSLGATLAVRFELGR